MPIPRSRLVAAQYWERRVQDRPDNGQSLKNLAPLLKERGDNKRSLRHMRAATEFAPADSDAANDFALSLFEAGKWHRAVDEFKRGLKLTPNHVCLRKNISACYARRGRFKEALEHAHEAVRLAPHDPQAHRNLAKILDAMGNTRDALEHNRISITCGPSANSLGQVREASDTDTYRIVARQSVARMEYKNKRGHSEDYYHSFRALSGAKYQLPYTATTMELLKKSRTQPEMC
jgi:tetratricopeptide (TPR) repeat protein